MNLLRLPRVGCATNVVDEVVARDTGGEVGRKRTVSEGTNFVFQNPEVVAAYELVTLARARWNGTNSRDRFCDDCAGRRSRFWVVGTAWAVAGLGWVRIECAFGVGEEAEDGFGVLLVASAVRGAFGIEGVHALGVVLEREERLVGKIGEILVSEVLTFLDDFSEELIGLVVLTVVLGVGAILDDGDEVVECAMNALVGEDRHAARLPVVSRAAEGVAVHDPHEHGLTLGARFDAGLE